VLGGIDAPAQCGPTVRSHAIERQLLQNLGGKMARFVTGR